MWILRQVLELILVGCIAMMLMFSCVDVAHAANIVTDSGVPYPEVVVQHVECLIQMDLLDAPRTSKWDVEDILQYTYNTDLAAIEDIASQIGGMFIYESYTQEGVNFCAGIY